MLATPLRRVGVVLLACPALLLAACTDDLELTASEAAQCRDFLDGVPDRVADLPGERDDLVIRFGEPPIEVRCQPTGEIPVTARCVSIDGYNWYLPDDQLEQVERAITATSAGGTLSLVVSIPPDYRPGDGILNDLNPALPQLARDAECE